MVPVLQKLDKWKSDLKSDFKGCQDIELHPRETLFYLYHFQRFLSANSWQKVPPDLKFSETQY